jgi:hypothetical protein
LIVEPQIKIKIDGEKNNIHSENKIKVHFSNSKIRYSLNQNDPEKLDLDEKVFQ